MPNLNRFTLIGNLTRDVQTKMVRDTAIAETGIAVNRKYRTAAGEDKEDVLFLDLTAFGKTAEILGQYARKGKLMYVEGRLRWESWEDKNGGGKRSKITGVVENFQFLSPKDDPDSAAGAFGDGGGGGQQRPAAAPARAASPQARRPAPGGGGRPAPSKAAAPAAADAGPPFGDEQQFNEADIPF
jgi:single-strand DNA-binding protein